MYSLSSKRSIVIFLFVVCAVSSAAAEQKSNRLTASDIFNLESVSDPQISPDGRKIIYVRGFNDIMTDGRYSNLWIINFDGSDNRPLTTNNYNDSSPRWSPDGNRVIFVSTRDGAPQIYVRWIDTGQTAKLTNLLSPPSGLAWSPDGKQISFTALVPAPPMQIATMPAPP